jgi:hypothetical protein
MLRIAKTEIVFLVFRNIINEIWCDYESIACRQKSNLSYEILFSSGFIRYFVDLYT